MVRPSQALGAMLAQSNGTTCWQLKQRRLRGSNQLRRARRERNAPRGIVVLRKKDTHTRFTFPTQAVLYNYSV